MAIVNDDSRVGNELETSLTDDARVIIHNCHMFIVQATGWLGWDKADFLPMNNEEYEKKKFLHHDFRSLMALILKEAQSRGWTLLASADVPAKFVSSNEINRRQGLHSQQFILFELVKGSNKLDCYITVKVCQEQIL
jgi:hypothetical protein